MSSPDVSFCFVARVCGFDSSGHGPRPTAGVCSCAVVRTLVPCVPLRAPWPRARSRSGCVGVCACVDGGHTLRMAWSAYLEKGSGIVILHDGRNDS